MDGGIGQAVGAIARWEGDDDGRLSERGGGGSGDVQPELSTAFACLRPLGMLTGSKVSLRRNHVG